MIRPSRSGGPPRRRDLFFALYPLGLLGLTLGLLVTPQASGPFALAKVFAPWLFVPLLLLLPLALLRGMFLLRLGLVAAIVTFLIVYPPALTRPPLLAPTTPQLTVLSWNLFVGEVSPAALRNAVARYDPDVVLLQEALWEPVAADASLLAAYPHQLLHPSTTAPGTLILSRYPIEAAGVPELPGAAWDMPRTTWARLRVAERPVVLVNSHPIPPRTFGTGCSVLRCYNRGPRDAQIAELRGFIEDLRHHQAAPLILGGDMNVTEREPAYQTLATGLLDAHRVAGWGFGASWRPADRPWLPPLIRIDYLFSADGAVPLDLITDCSEAASDHCLIVGRFGLP
ncbi:MAG: endonuclease/exonuclease/phosphatase family protein [Oscillochloridaceae bacterium umkhey_bin13]